MMTRKHFEATAEILKFASDKTHPALFSKMVNDFAMMFAKENERFDVNKFHEACGYHFPKLSTK
jgi:hypothetical protein